MDPQVAAMLAALKGAGTSSYLPPSSRAPPPPPTPSWGVPPGGVATPYMAPPGVQAAGDQGASLGNASGGGLTQDQIAQMIMQQAQNQQNPPAQVGAGGPSARDFMQQMGLQAPYYSGGGAAAP